MAATFTLKDGTTIPGITTYSEVKAKDAYSVFSPAGHQYVPVADVAEITHENTPRAKAWYDLPIAAGMWAADGADLRA